MPEGKKVEAMFSRIFGGYDFLNHFLSCGTDVYWRWLLARRVVRLPHRRVLDLATGTGDLAVALYRRKRFEGIVFGVDFCRPMLRVAQSKHLPVNIQADALKLPFADGVFDVVTIAFGLRNLESLERGLREMLRVVRPGGRVLILEFSQPWLPLRPFYFFYLQMVLPTVAGLLSGQREAYEYLGQTIRDFPDQDRLRRKMREAGFVGCAFENLTGGIVCIHEGIKKPLDPSEKQ
ncbi:MAG: class I SAM-dependent methyltransferase [Verrucomicrobiae bacterium]|nr:class I SAM-dependent methyltransferase [Verrucomicrobiae bacterium]